MRKIKEKALWIAKVLKRASVSTGSREEAARLIYRTRKAILGRVAGG